MRYQVQAWIAALAAPKMDGLPAIARQIAAEFPTPSAETDARLQRELRESVADLDFFLTNGGQQGQLWKKYLQWDGLLRLANMGYAYRQPELLESVHARFDSGAAGLQLAQFSRVERTLRAALQRALLDPVAEVNAEYQARLTGLATLLENQTPEKIDVENQARLGTAILWLEQRGLAARLTKAIRQYYVRPNLILTIGAHRLLEDWQRTFTEDGNVNEYVLGTPVSGRAETKGTIQSALIPNPYVATIEIDMTLHTVANTVGRHPEASIYSQSNVNLTARKRIEITGADLRPLPATATGQVTTGIGNVSAGGGRRDQIGFERAQAMRGQSEAEASRRARAGRSAPRSHGQRAAGRRRLAAAGNAAKAVAAHRPLAAVDALCHQRQRTDSGAMAAGRQSARHAGESAPGVRRRRLVPAAARIDGLQSCGPGPGR